MSVSFIGELNEIVIFRPATAHPEPITLIKVTTLYEASRTGISDHHIRLTREHQQWQWTLRTKFDFESAYFKFHVLEQVKETRISIILKYCNSAAISNG
jgi:hypothetical protein